MILLCATTTVVWLLAGCESEEWGSLFLRSRTEIGFEVATSYLNGDAGSAETKTVYSGERGVFSFSGDNVKMERIDWSAGDKVRVYCNQATPVNSSNHFADYSVLTASAGSPDSWKSVSNQVEPVAVGGKKDGLQWNRTPGTSHHFFAVYPSPSAVAADKQVSIQIGGNSTLLPNDYRDDAATADIALYSGRIPQTQKVVAVTENKHRVSSSDKQASTYVEVKEYEPDMEYVAMAAYREATLPASPSTNILMRFKPLATVIRFELMADADDALPKNNKLTRIRLISSSDEYPLYGLYDVAVGKYSTHKAIDEDPKQYVFKAGPGINDNAADPDNLDNGMATVRVRQKEDNSFVKADNYLQIVPDGTSFPSEGIQLSTTKPAAFTFICLPSRVEMLTLELTFGGTCDADGNVTSPVGTRTLPLMHSDTWIHVSERNKAYFDAINVRKPQEIFRVVPINYDFPTESKSYAPYFTVLSYRGDGATAQPLGWTAEFSTTGDMGSYTSTVPDWITSFCPTGESGKVNSDAGNTAAPATAKNFTVAVSANAPNAWTWPDVRDGGVGHGANDLSVPANVPDLSKRDIYGNNQADRETANCYVVSGPGWYKIPAVYGNAIMKGQTNASAYTGKYSGSVGNTSGYNLGAFVNHTGAPITDPWIKNNGITIAKVKVLWQDFDQLVTNPCIRDATHPDLEEDFIYFELHQRNEGNAVIAAYDANDVIVWSWHIWMVFNPNEALRTICLEPADDFAAGVDHVHLLNENLGYTRVSNNAFSRVCHVRFTQAETGNTAYIVISQTGSEKGNSTLYYQWGRKDPMFPSIFIGENNSTNFVRNAKIFNGEGGYFKGTPGKTVAYDDANGLADNKKHPNPDRVAASTSASSIPYSISHPAELLSSENGTPYSSGDMRTWMGNKVYFNLWNTDLDKPVRRSVNGGTDSDAYSDGEKNRPDLPVVKTIYDPCPPGFKVPNEYAFTAFNTTWNPHSLSGSQYANVAVNEGYTKENMFDADAGYIFKANQQGDPTHGRSFFPAAGYRKGDGNEAILEKIPKYESSMDSHGNVIQSVDVTGQYWTAASYILLGGSKRWAYGKTFRFSKNSVQPLYGAFGYPSNGAGFLMCHAQCVRPVADANSSRTPVNHNPIHPVTP